MNHIEQVNGPCIILAGAGTGKTRSMVDKVKYIVEKEIYRPEEIVCVTFSNEAARSLQARIMGAIGETDVVVKTFHSLCADLLKREGHRIGIKEDFKILLPDEAMVYLYKFFKINPNRCRDYVSAIGMAKDLGISLEDYENFLNEKKKSLPVNFERELEVLQFQLNTLIARKDKSLYKKTLQDKIDNITTHMKRQRFFMAWKAYEKLKNKRGFQDYSDLNKNAFILLEKYPEVIKWKYCIVDEFQDTNKMQVDFLSLIAPHRNITIVGDLNQSIYRFRGAYKNNIDNFKESFNVRKENIYELDKSHRSPNIVLRTAHKLISKNYDNKDDCFFVENAHGIEGDLVEVYELKNAREEVRKIMEIIDSEINRGTKEEEICVMFRTHHQANLLKKALEIKGLNFSATNRKSLLKDDRVRQIVAYLEAIYNLKNNRSASASLWDLVYHMSFSREDLEKIGEFLRKNGRDEKANEILKGVLELSENGKKQIAALDLRIQELLNCYDLKLPDLIEKIKMFFDFSELEETKKGVESVLAVKLFDEMVKDYTNFEAEDIASFIYHIEAIRSLNLEMDAPSVGSSGVKIMTAHSTKGLEYDVVIVANLVKGKFPIERVTTNSLIPPEISPELKEVLLGKSESDKEEIVRFYEYENQIKEERRLCYVAFTRTKKRLYVTYSKDYGNKKHEPSQFLEELGFRDNKDIKFEIDNFEKYVELTSIKNDVSAYPEKEITFSPSALNTFADCQKRYEYKYVLGMPETIPKNNESIVLGSFVHSVIEFGVKENIKDERGFMYLAKEFSLKPEWEGVQADEAFTLLRVFFQRNKDKYNTKSVSEENLFANLDGFKFRGIADRIDIHSDGVEIIDYKTGYANVPPRARNWQLGFYALAAAQKYGRVKRVTLDMLRHDKPLEFDMKQNGLAVERNSGRMSFSLEAVRQELIEAAQSIKEAYKKGFVPCSVEKNCEFCNEWVWKI